MSVFNSTFYVWIFTRFHVLCTGFLLLWKHCILIRFHLEKEIRKHPILFMSFTSNGTYVICSPFMFGYTIWMGDKHWKVHRKVGDGNCLWNAVVFLHVRRTKKAASCELDSLTKVGVWYAILFILFSLFFFVICCYSSDRNTYSVKISTLTYCGFWDTVRR